MIKKKIDVFLEKLLILILSLMLLVVVWQVISRFLIGNPSTVTDEIASFLLIWLGLFGAAYATGQRLHLSVELIPKQLLRKHHGLFQWLIWGSIGLFAVLVLVIGGFRLCYLTLILDQKSAALEIPLALVYSVIPLSGLLVLFYCLEVMLKDPFKLNG